MAPVPNSGFPAPALESGEVCIESLGAENAVELPKIVGLSALACPKRPDAGAVDVCALDCPKRLPVEGAVDGVDWNGDAVAVDVLLPKPLKTLPVPFC